MATDWRLFLGAWLVTCAYSMMDDSDQFLQSIERTKITPKPGRHVCMTESVISRPVPVIQMYKKPVYTSRPRDCPNLANCPQYDVKYIPSNRTVYQLQRFSKFEHRCCPGWTKSTKREKGCMGPICRNGCGEFGVCVKPDTCQCQTGFSGDMCDTDVDECKGLGHGCAQICKNTAGSYMCACQEGFVLASDGRTCIFCFTCQREYTEMMETIASLQSSLQSVQADRQNQKTDEIGNLTEEIKLLRLEVASLQKKNEMESERQDNATLTAELLKLKLDELVKENLELKDEIGILAMNQTFLREDFEVLKPIPVSPDESVTTTTKTTPLTTTTSRPTTTQSSYGYRFDPRTMMVSLSNQIGLLEEKLDLCQCQERLPYK